jgi:hypothetical protein
MNFLIFFNVIVFVVYIEFTYNFIIIVNGGCGNAIDYGNYLWVLIMINVSDYYNLGLF